MRKYILKRLLLSLATIFALITLTFFLLKAIPGSPFDPSKMSAASYEKLMAYYGLDKPIFTQYIRYLGNLFKGDLGYTISGSRSINTIIAQSLPRSMTLGLTALVFALVFGLTLGVISALNRGKVVDKFIIFVVVLFVSVPSFVIASLFQYFFCFKLGIFPIIAIDYSFHNYFIPSVCLCLGTIASLSRLMRTSMLEVVSADYVKTAKSKGLKKSKIIVSHQMRNAMLPIVTVLGPTTAFLLTGTFVIERIFSINGLGKYFVDSISTAEVGLTMALTIVFGTFLIVCNFVVDVLYGVIDPRIRIY